MDRAPFVDALEAFVVLTELLHEASFFSGPVTLADIEAHNAWQNEAKARFTQWLGWLGWDEPAFYDELRRYLRNRKDRGT